MRLYDNLASRLPPDFRARLSFYDLNLYFCVSDYPFSNFVC